MRRLLLFVALAVAGCSDIASPSLVSVYQYGLVNGIDTLYFHWPRSRLPVRIWVADTSVLKPYVSTAIHRWESVFLYGEWDAITVADSTHADVIVVSLVSGGQITSPGGVLNRRAAECSGVTETPDVDTHTLTLPIHVFIAPNVISTNPALATCYSITTTHEIGHSLGLLAHSSITTDIMYSDPRRDSISENDRETAVTAYHVPSNVTITNQP